MIERKGLISLIEMFRPGMELIEARNGKEAMEIIRRQKPDVVISDIKMPFMTGLEIAEEIGEVSPDTVMVIISGYSDFEYARQAIKSGVHDYVLKPVDPDEFKNTLDEVLDKIEEREETEEQMQRKQDFLGEYFLQKYIHQDKPEVLEEAAAAVDVSWWKDISRLLLLEMNSDFFEDHEDEFQAKLLKELQLSFFYLNLSPDRSLLLFADRKSLDFQVMGAHIHDFIKKEYHEDCYIAISSSIEKIDELPGRYQEVELLMENRFYRQETWVFMPDMKLEEKDDMTIQLFERMEEDIRLRDVSHLWEHFGKLKIQGQTIGQYSQIFTKFSCFNIIKELYRDMDIPMEKCNDEVEALYECKTITKVFSILEKNIQRYEDTMFADKGSARMDVEKIKSYIYEHYAEELSAEILGRGVYLSPGYTSYIFKKETGEGLSRFIRVYRLEKAKELLQSTNKKIAQICFETGFNNSSYFCKSFREYYGCSPERFRRGEGVI